MYEFVCKNCGKREMLHSLECRSEKVFCNRKCWKEWCEKRRKTAEDEKTRHILTPAKVPEKYCKKCKYGCRLSHFWSCSYFEVAGNHTRHFLHPEGLTDECQEFEPRKRGRPKKI